MKYFLISAEDLPLAPAFTTTTTGYDPPSFYSNSEGPSGGSRLYGDGYRDQEIYPGDPGYRSQNYSLYPGNNGLSVDLPVSPDSGLGSDQVK